MEREADSPFRAIRFPFRVELRSASLDSTPPVHALVYHYTEGDANGLAQVPLSTGKEVALYGARSSPGGWCQAGSSVWIGIGVTCSTPYESGGADYDSVLTCQSQTDALAK